MVHTKSIDDSSRDFQAKFGGNCHYNQLEADGRSLDAKFHQLNNMKQQSSLSREHIDHHGTECNPIHVDGVVPVSKKAIPRLNIAMLVVGTRGDVQPFLAVALKLQEYGHHVRLATHVSFSDFVKSAGVEFYPLGGDPRVLAGYMARNKGLPLAPGELIIQRKQLKAIVESILPACTEPDRETGAPFTAQAIIANPPVYGQVHVAEALGVPLHIIFTTPWTPTNEFPLPIAHLPKSPGNRMSYVLVDLLIWWFIRDLINDLRRKKLKLPPIPYLSMYCGSLHHLPTGYMWSRHVLPKPKDWGSLVDVVGYCFLNDGSNYQPSGDLVNWIKKGSKPIYIGFGSMLLDDPKKITEIVVEALKSTGERGILSRGWGGLGDLSKLQVQPIQGLPPQSEGGDTILGCPISDMCLDVVVSEVADYVFILDDCPHDWLFPQCCAVIHHGGAGTTASGLKAGCPTTVIPFFGDQFFWGDKIHQKGLGPEPVPITHLSIETLSNAIRFMLQPEVKSRAIEMGQLIEREDGVATAVDAFHRHLKSELAMPAVLPVLREEDSCPSTVQWLFVQIGKFCCQACS